MASEGHGSPVDDKKALEEAPARAYPRARQGLKTSLKSNAFIIIDAKLNFA
jgi:hypothetical protein